MTNSSLTGIINVTFLDLDTPPALDKVILSSVDKPIQFDVDYQIYQDVYVLSGSLPPRSLLVNNTAFNIAWDASVWSVGADNRGFAIHISWDNVNGIFIVSFCILISWTFEVEQTSHYMWCFTSVLG